MSSGNKPLPEAMLTQIYVAIWRHEATNAKTKKKKKKNTYVWQLGSKATCTAYDWYRAHEPTYECFTTPDVHVFPLRLTKRYVTGGLFVAKLGHLTKADRSASYIQIN